MDGGSLAPGQLPVPGGSDRDNYQAAFELLKEQRYEPAAMAFQQFLVSFPDSPTTHSTGWRSLIT
jgi:TolA-binding protein